MPHFVVLVNYRDIYNRKGTARLKIKAPDALSAAEKAKKELAEIEKFSTRKNIRKFNLNSIQVVQQADPRKQEGLLISRNNIRPGLEVWELKGTIDANTNKQFDDLLREAIMEGTDKIVFDCRGLDYINSTGIGSIVGVNSEIEIKLANLPHKIAEIFIVVGLDQLLRIFHSVEEALQDF